MRKQMHTDWLAFFIVIGLLCVLTLIFFGCAARGGPACKAKCECDCAERAIETKTPEVSS